MTKTKQTQSTQSYILFGGGLLLIVAAFIVWAATQSSTPTSTGNTVTGGILAQGQPAPVFTAHSLTNQQITLSDYQGDVVLVNFWATWCPPCKAEMPDLNAFYEAHKEEGFTVLAVNAYEDESLVRPFIEANGFTFPVLLDPDGIITDYYKVRSYPTSIIIDRTGTVRHIQIGLIFPEQLDSYILPLLES